MYIIDRYIAINSSAYLKKVRETFVSFHFSMALDRIPVQTSSLIWQHLAALEYRSMLQNQAVPTLTMSLGLTEGRSSRDRH